MFMLHSETPSHSAINNGNYTALPALWKKPTWKKLKTHARYAAAAAAFNPLIGFLTLRLITNDPQKHYGLGLKRQRGDWEIEFNPATQGKGDLSES